MLYLPKSGFRREPRQGRSRALVQDILVAADGLFIARGYDKVSVADIAKRAGVSIGSLYQYFESKDAIAVECVRERMHRNLEALESALNECTHLGFEAGVTRLTESVAASLAKDYPMRMLFISHLAKTPETDVEIPSRYQQLLVRFLRTHAPKANDQEIQDVASQIIHSFAGIALARENVFASAEYVMRTRDLFVAVLRASLPELR